MMGAFHATILGLLCSSALSLTVNPRQDSPPTVQIQNGSISGVSNPTYNQDLFLGIPYAQPPVGPDLRFRAPQPLQQAWNGTLAADKYYPECVGYGGDQIGYEVSEDCLVVNVIRPSGMEGEALPVGVWIHGGGLYQGGASDLRYNLSFIVNNSVEIGKPIMAVSIAYRLQAWGFLDGEDIRAEGSTNVGLKDQRLALRWIQENIAAFGGDPKKVTIFGESAGAWSTGIHVSSQMSIISCPPPAPDFTSNRDSASLSLLYVPGLLLRNIRKTIAYGGKDEGLFSAVIGQSGNAVIPQYNATAAQASFDNVTQAAGCAREADKLACLRNQSFEILNEAFNVTGLKFPASPDGGIIPKSPYNAMLSGDFVKVPYLIGTNSDEGSGGFGAKGINNDSDFRAYLLKQGFDEGSASIIEAVYPDIPAVGIPASLNRTLNETWGYQYKRVSALGGDFAMTAGRRFISQQYARYNVTTYAYRFNTIPYPLPLEVGVAHFQEVAFVFDNTEGLGYADNPFTDAPQSYLDLAKLMSCMWASFIATGDPNNHGIANTPVWPVYMNGEGGRVETGNGGYGKDMVFQANGTGSYVEDDTYRAEGIAALNRMWGTVFNR